RLGWVGGVGCVVGDGDVEAGAVAGLALDGDGALVFVDDCFDDGEAEAAAGGGAGFGFGGAVEAFEEVGLVFGGDAGAVVADFECDGGGVGVGGDVDLAVGGGVFDCV